MIRLAEDWGRQEAAAPVRRPMSDLVFAAMAGLAALVAALAMTALWPH